MLKERMLSHPQARMMADMSWPQMRNSCATPTRSECPETSHTQGRVPLAMEMESAHYFWSSHAGSLVKCFIPAYGAEDELATHLDTQAVPATIVA